MGQKEQIGPVSGQNVGPKIHMAKWMYFVDDRTLEASSQSLFIYLKHISIGVIFCLEEQNL